MHIAEGYKDSHNIYRNDNEMEFFDCEEIPQGTNYDNEIYYDLPEEITEPIVTLTEDVKHTLVHLLNILTSYEADRFSISLIYKAGLAIPFSLLTAAHSFYRSWSRGENIGAVLMNGFPFFVQAILPHSGKLMLLANYIKIQVEERVGIDNLPFQAGYGDPSENGYLGLGILALLGEYYLAGHPVPAPKRPGLRLPVSLAQLFSRICRYWHILCATALPESAPPSDPFGRMALSAGERKEQREGRMLARHWVGNIPPRQIQLERIAESYYGIEKPRFATPITTPISATMTSALTATMTGPLKDRNHHRDALLWVTTSSLTNMLVSTVITPLRRVLHALGQGVITVLLPFPAVSGAALNSLTDPLAPPATDAVTGATSNPPAKTLPPPETVTLNPIIAAKLNLSSESLLPAETTTINKMYRGPLWTTPYVQLNRYLRGRYPAITHIVAQHMTEAISRRFGVSLNPDNSYLHHFATPLPGPGTPAEENREGKPVCSLTLTEFALKRYFTHQFEDLAALDRYYGVYKGNETLADTRQNTLLPFSPSDLIALLEPLELTAAYQHELHHYRHGNRGLHALANFINLVNMLDHHRQQLSPRDSDLFMQSLGLGQSGGYRVKASLFDINGYLATDLLVLEAHGLPRVLLYLPRAQQPLWSFENSTVMRQWIIRQSRDALWRHELLNHFALQDRTDSGMIFGRWGVDRWLENIADYPEYIWQKKEYTSEPLYEILTVRQLERAWADAAFLPHIRQALPGNKDNETSRWIDGLYALPIAPFTVDEPLKDELPGLTPPATPQTAPTSSRLALSLLMSAAGEILPFDDKGIIQFSAGPKIALSLFQSIINYDMQAGTIPQNVNRGAALVVEALSVMPSGYVRAHRRWPNGRIDMHFSITLPVADGQQRENLTAIRLLGRILPLRFNSRLKTYEVYDIHHEANPGYPVSHNEKNQWQFGRSTGHEHHERSAVSMAVYSHISVRLYEKLMENLNELCQNAADLTPVNSLGIAQDADGTDYLSIKNHFFKMSEGLAEGIFLLRGENDIKLKIRFDNKWKKFLYIPDNDFRASPYEKPILPAKLIKSTDFRLSYRQGFRSADNKNCRLALAAEKSLIHSGLKKIIYYGLSEGELALKPRYAPQAMAIRKGLGHCDKILRELLSSKERPRLREGLYIALQITGAGKNAQQRAWSLFINNLEKTQSLLDNHAGEGYRRIWGASFDPFTTALISLKSDPLKRLWFNVRFRQPKGQHNHYLAHYCHYGCKEIPPAEDFASISRSVGTENDPQGVLLINPVFKDDFPRLVSRLQAGNISSDEINSLAGLSEAANVQHLAFLSDKKLARRLFRTNATARSKMILTDADRFSHLLLHLHATLNDRSCEHPYLDSVRMTLFMLAWQAL